MEALNVLCCCLFSVVCGFRMVVASQFARCCFLSKLKGLFVGLASSEASSVPMSIGDDTTTLDEVLSIVSGEDIGLARELLS